MKRNRAERPPAGPFEHTGVADECSLPGESGAPQLGVVVRPSEAGGKNAGHKFAPCDTGRLQQQLFLRAERLHLLMDHGRQALGHALAQFVEIGNRPPAVRLEHYRRGRFPVIDQGQDEKRIPAGPLVHRVHESSSPE